MAKLVEIIELVSVDGDKPIYIVDQKEQKTIEYEDEVDDISNLLNNPVISIDIFDSSVFITLA